jgi:hypothetical protein
VFDEIEYISPIAIDDIQWKKDFIDFWQTFWACQSKYRKISTIIAGVNPSVVEVDSYSGIQNPLFGIVSYQYLTGFTEEEVARMLRTLGKRMGIQFEQDSIGYLHERYGGHPLLTRIAASLINLRIKEKKLPRPVAITKSILQTDEESRDSDLMFYCRHVVSELRQFYSEEYEMLELLASGQISDINELSSYPEFVKHLESYGLLSRDRLKKPLISIPVVSRYIGLELAKREGRKSIYRIVPVENRNNWINKRLRDILNDIRHLEKIISNTPMNSLFGTNSFPEADTFLNISITTSESEFSTFINICNRCYVESIINYGKEIGLPNYYFNEIKHSYQGLWDALERIRLYRHNYMHLKLFPSVNQQMIDLLKSDLEGKTPGQVIDLYFVLQQCVLDGLLSGVQTEIFRIGS